MDLKKTIATFLTLASAVGILFALDSRYEHAQAAEQAVKELRTDIEKVSLQNQLATQRARLSFLVNKSKLSEDEKLEAEWTRAQLILLQKQLAELQK